MYDQWTIAIFFTMKGYSPAIFRGYRVWYVGIARDKPKADNDNTNWIEGR